MQRTSSRPITAMLIIVVLIIPAALAAQAFWLEGSQEKTFLLEILKPKAAKSGVFNGVSYPVDYSFATSALFLSLRQPLGSKIFLVAELPFAHAAFDKKIDRAFSFYRHNGRSNRIGNPYLGLELGSPASRIYPEVGIRPPLLKAGDNYAAEVGKIADSDRREAFEHTTALRVMLNVRLKYKTRLSFRCRGGPIFQRDFDNPRQSYRAVSGNFRVRYEMARINLGVYTGLRLSKIKSPTAGAKQYKAINVMAQAEYEMGRISLGVNAGIRMSDVSQSEIKTAYTRGSDFNLHEHLGLAASVRFGN